MESISRKVEKIVTPQWITDGRGVRLRRSIAIRTLDYLDPFLVFDHFKFNQPSTTIPGFSMHPHRGIETVTYMLAGRILHKDSMGNNGDIRAGDIQWMTAGRGIMHKEIPKLMDGKLEGFQLWVNLPAKYKMIAPRYQDIFSRQIPEVELENGVFIRIIAGQVEGVAGAVSSIATNPDFLDVSMPENTSFYHPVERGHSAFSYVIQGGGTFGKEGVHASEPRLIVWKEGDYVEVCTNSQPVRFLLISSKPLLEPIVRYGPFVMNTQEEIEQVLKDLREGTFV